MLHAFVINKLTRHLTHTDTLNCSKCPSLVGNLNQNGNNVFSAASIATKQKIVVGNHVYCSQKASVMSAAAVLDLFKFSRSVRRCRGAEPGTAQTHAPNLAYELVESGSRRCRSSRIGSLSLRRSPGSERNGRSVAHVD